MLSKARTASAFPRIAIALLTLSGLAMWWPALRTPFWGDDYVFLHAARATNLSGAPWWSDFWPTSPPRFWRPLSQEGYWRWVDAVLDGSPIAAHLVSLGMHVLATLALALLAFRLARACGWAHAGTVAGLSGAMYGALTMHMLPVHWTAALNNSLLTLFTTLLLSAWIGASAATGRTRVALFASLPALLSLALLSKESAAVMPALMLVVFHFVSPRWPDRAEWVTWLACVAVVAVWLMLRERFTANTDASYSLQLGSNVLRNAASFLAWMSNVPREAMRMAIAGERTQGLAWIAVTALPMVTVWLFGWWKGRSLLARRQWLCVFVFAVVAYGPYFLFAWNSYEYYAAVSAILPVIALAYSLAATRLSLLAVVLVGLSSWIGVEGTRRLEHPGLIGRAHEAERTLRALQQEPITVPVHVSATDAQRFYAIGQMGLAWRLGVSPEQIVVDLQCPPTGTCLVFADGDWHWQIFD